ncbi:MAG: hypothetical protein ACP5F1_05130 [Thermoplasmata archaeon]
MIVKLIGITLINVNGKDARYLTFEISEKDENVHVSLSPELKNLANMAGLNENTLTYIFQSLQQIQSQKYTFSWIIFSDEYIDLGINFTVGKLYELIYENSSIKINIID